MDAPQIRYARSSDGVRIAYWTLGSGFPLVFPPSVPFSYGRVEWEIPELREWYQSFARDYMLVRYDNRGTGLSDRNIAEHTVEAMVNDLEGVVDALSLQRFALFGMGHSGPVSIAYSVRHPERVTRLLLWSTYAQAAEYLQLSRLQALASALADDREAARVAFIATLAGSADSTLQHRLVDLDRRARSADYAELRRQAPTIDVTGLLSQVSVPTVVMHRPDYPLRRDTDALDLVNGIPDARLISFEGRSSLWFDDPIVTETMRDFLSEDSPTDYHPLQATEARPPGTGEPMPKFFISYRRGDSAGHTGRLYDRLVDHFGQDQVFMDIDAISPGLDFVEAVQQAIAVSDGLIAVIGQDWLTATDGAGGRRLDQPDDMVRLEIAAALERGILVIPVLVQGAQMPRSGDLPEALKDLASRNALEISDARFRSDVDRLIQALQPPKPKPSGDAVPVD